MEQNAEDSISMHRIEQSVRDLAVAPIAQPTSAETNQYIRLIRRMETASSQLILDRLEEDWDDCHDASVMEELRIEKLLWTLTALDRKLLGIDPNIGDNESSADSITVHFEGNMGKQLCDP